VPLKGIRTELDILNSHVCQAEPDLEFILVHAESLLSHARIAATGDVYPDTSPEDRELIRRYLEKKRSAS